MEIEVICNTPDEAIFANVAVNSATYRKWLYEWPAHEGHAVIVGGGPSLADTLPLIQQRHAMGQHIFALNGACGFLNKHDILPEYQVVLDARPGNERLLGHAFDHLIASQCDPAVFARVRAHFKEEPTLWHPAIEGLEGHLPRGAPSYTMIGGGTTVGLSTMCLAYAMGYRKLHLFGFDCSHRDGQGHAYAQTSDPLCKVTVCGQAFTSTLTMVRQAELFPAVSDNLISLGCTITLDGGGYLRAVLAAQQIAVLPPLAA